ncbi:MAG: PilN domain-containing protein [Selenomonadaceae bacterium]|nr:PilN domain-containing protein [Selenomonadaceae bacterium]
MIGRLKKFFRADTSEIISVYFDGEKIFIARLTEKFETAEIEADGAEIEQLAEKISRECRQRGWKTSLVGFCLREEDAVTFQTEVANVPEKEIPALVKSWALAQTGAGAAFSFAKIGEELWMETVPRAKVEEFSAAFEKFNMNLRGLSVMPVDMLSKISPFDRTEFITEVVRDRKSPNLLSGHGGAWNWKKISLAIAAIFFIAIFIGSAKLFFDYSVASNKLDAAKTSIDEVREDLALKENLDATVAELRKINQLAAQIEIKPNFNLLVNLGKIVGGDVHLTEIRVDGDALELKGVADNSDAVKSYLSRVKNSVVNSARLESSAESDDGEIIFVIRANLK